MSAADRLLEIEEKFRAAVQRTVPKEIDESTLRVILYLKDGTNLRVTEQWENGKLRRYSYYWLSSDNKLKIGWDNAPHHTQLEKFPHHKHIKQHKNLHPSEETCLEKVMEVILEDKKAR
jgi:uncharacterized protein DUF6516